MQLSLSDKTEYTKKAHELGIISHHWRTTLHWYIRWFNMPAAAYQKKQQDHIHDQSCSCIV